MRLLTGLSIVSLVVSIAAVVLVLGLYAELEKSEPEEHTQELNETMVRSMISQHVSELIESAGITWNNRDEMDEAWASVPGYECIWVRYYGNGYLHEIPDVYEPGGYVNYNYIKSDDIWLVTSASGYCDELTTWAIDDNTGEITYGHPDEK